MFIGADLGYVVPNLFHFDDIASNELLTLRKSAYLKPGEKTAYRLTTERKKRSVDKARLTCRFLLATSLQECWSNSISGLRSEFGRFNFYVSRIS